MIKMIYAISDKNKAALKNEKNLSSQENYNLY